MTSGVYEVVRTDEVSIGGSTWRVEVLESRQSKWEGFKARLFELAEDQGKPCELRVADGFMDGIVALTADEALELAVATLRRFAALRKARR